MTDVLIFGGPVSTFDLKGLQFARPTQLITIGQGLGGSKASDAFAGLAASLRDGNGRILPAILAKVGLTVDTVDRVAIAGFSAFHGLASPLLAADGDRISAAVLLDACFSAASNPPKSGFVSFGAMAADGQRLMVFTASSGQNAPPLPPSTTGWQCALANAGAAASAAGVALHAAEAPAGVPPPTQGGVFRAQDLWVLDYRAQYPHGDHVHVLAVPVLQKMLVPYMVGMPVGPPEAPPAATTAGWVKPVVVVLGVAAIAGGAWALTRKKRRSALRPHRRDEPERAAGSPRHRHHAEAPYAGLRHDVPAVRRPSFVEA